MLQVRTMTRPESAATAHRLSWETLPRDEREKRFLQEHPPFKKRSSSPSVENPAFPLYLECFGCVWKHRRKCEICCTAKRSQDLFFLRLMKLFATYLDDHCSIRASEFYAALARNTSGAFVCLERCSTSGERTNASGHLPLR